VEGWAVTCGFSIALPFYARCVQKHMVTTAIVKPVVNTALMMLTRLVSLALTVSGSLF
jgi:hypothetical protein